MRIAKLLKLVSARELKDLLNTYKPEQINTVPFTEKELYGYYENYTDPLLIFVRKMSDDNVFLLGNEARAMFGHLADYRLNSVEKKNLQDAYGHFRRLNIDALKVLCNELDKAFITYLKKHYQYDFRNTRRKFLFEYSQKYFVAQKAYLNAQMSEHVGSDRLFGNIILEYYEAAKKYLELFTFLENTRKGLEKVKIAFFIKYSVNFIISVLGIVLSLLPTA